MVHRLILIAQGETAAARGGRFACADDPLDERGRQAACDARAALPRHDSALTSPAAAARETAALLGLAPQVEPGLRDLDLGDWAGRGLTEIAGTEPPSAIAAYLADPDFAGHGGEPHAALVDRVGAFLDGRRATEGVTLALTHGAVMRAALVAVLRAPPAAVWGVEITPLAALVLGGDGRRWTLRTLGPLACLGRDASHDLRRPGQRP